MLKRKSDPFLMALLTISYNYTDVHVSLYRLMHMYTGCILAYA